LCVFLIYTKDFSKDYGTREHGKDADEEDAESNSEGLVLRVNASIRYKHVADPSRRIKQFNQSIHSQKDEKDGETALIAGAGCKDNIRAGKTGTIGDASFSQNRAP
jgi:hypothetical protein